MSFSRISHVHLVVGQKRVPNKCHPTDLGMTHWYPQKTNSIVPRYLGCSKKCLQERQQSGHNVNAIVSPRKGAKVSPRAWTTNEGKWQHYGDSSKKVNDTKSVAFKDLDKNRDSALTKADISPFQHINQLDTITLMSATNRIHQTTHVGIRSSHFMTNHTMRAPQERSSHTTLASQIRPHTIRSHVVYHLPTEHSMSPTLATTENSRGTGHHRHVNMYLWYTGCADSMRSPLFVITSGCNMF